MSILADVHADFRHFIDVTLVSAEGEQATIHPLILGATSSFFRKIFLDLPDSERNPIVYLPDFSLFEVNHYLEALIGQVPGENPLLDVLSNYLNFSKDEKEKDKYKAANVDIGSIDEPKLKEENIHLASQMSIDFNMEYNENEMKTVSHSEPDRDIKCPYCEKIFITNKRMQCHLSLSHEIMNDYMQDIQEKERNNTCTACAICGKRLSDRTSLKRHHLTNHASDEEKNLARKHKCKSCPNRFYTKHKLATHAFMHSENKSFSCDNCFVYFKTPYNMRRHMIRKHLGKLIN